MQTTVIRKVKRGKGLGRWPAYILAEDTHGLWLYCPAGTIYRGQNTLGEIIWQGEVGQGNRDEGLAVVHLIPHSAWWIASWVAEGANSVIAVDICTPPTLIDGEWRYDDLDLDPHAFGDGRVEIHDQDEFAEACAAGVTSSGEALSARIAADEVARCLLHKIEPFGRVGWDKLDKALRLALPPLIWLRGL